MTAEALRNEYAKPSYNTSFYSFYEVELQKKKSGLSANMYEKYDVTLRKLKRFRQELTFAGLDSDLLNEFSAYCKKIGNCQNTVNANLKNIKFFVRLAYRKKLIFENVFTDYKIGNIKPMRIFLTESELSKIIITFKRKYSMICNARFCKLSYFLASRDCDFQMLKRQDLITLLITSSILFRKEHPISTKKLKFRSVLLQKKMINWDKKTRKVFDVYSSQYVNRELKHICESAGIKKRITFHCARHTFATMYLRKTNDIAGLQKLLGHSNISETMIYAHALDDDIRENIKSLDTIFT